MNKQMRGYLEYLKIWCLQHKVFASALFVQALVVAYFVVRLFAPKVFVDVPLESFVTQDTPAAAVYQASGLSIQNDASDESPIMVTSSAFSLAPGAYQVRVQYKSVTNLEHPSSDINQYAAGVYLATIQSPVPFSAYDLVLLLRDSAQQLERIIWTGYQNSQASVTVYYTGTGQINITSIQIEEQTIWRWTMLGGAILLFVLLDFCLWYGYRLRPWVKKELRKTVWQHQPSKYSVFMALLGIAFVATIPLFFTNEIYDVDDIHFHITRIAAVAAELSNGQFPVRMMTEMMNGYGYANSLFYCDMFLYLPAVLYNAMLSLPMAYLVYVASLQFVTAAIAYYAFGKMAQDVKIGLVGAILYTLSAYRLSNVYWRAAVGEYTAMAFLPLIVLGLWQIYQAEKPCWHNWLPLALGMAGVIQSHVLSVQIVVVFLVLFCIVTCRRTFCMVRIKSLAFATLLCMGLTAWFWVPFLQSTLTLPIAAYDCITDNMQNTGLKLSQFFSLYGYTDPQYYVRGYLGWALIAGMLLVVWCILRKGQWRCCNSWNKKAVQIATAFGVVACVLSLRLFPWQAIASIHPMIGKMTNTIQFPWRYLMIATVCFVLAVVLALVLLKQNHWRWYRASVAVLLCMSMVTTGLLYLVLLLQTPTFAWKSMEVMDTMRSGNGEYFLQESGYTDAYDTAVIADGDLRVEDYQKIDGIAYLTVENTSADAQVVSLPIWNYPNYQATDAETGEQLAIITGENNRLQVSVAQGYAGTVQVRYVSPWYWHLAELVSLGSWLFVAGMAIYQRRNKDGIA